MGNFTYSGHKPGYRNKNTARFGGGLFGFVMVAQAGDYANLSCDYIDKVFR